MCKLARLCKRLERIYGLRYCVTKSGRRYYVYFFDSFRSDWFLDGWFDRLSDVEDFLINCEA